MELSVQTGSLLSEAEVAREMGLLYQTMGRKEEALAYLQVGRTLFGRLDAKLDLADISKHINQLEESLG
jgi:hypothetical protein